MADPNTDAAAKLETLGTRLRQTVATQHPAEEQDIQTALGAVREQWEQEQEAQRQKKQAPGKAPQRGPEPPEPDR
jgi:hypothetical protein